ncbi:hypothetical protein XENOCAPTIV_017049, partial [Xenoophorus captivus]
HQKDIAIIDVDNAPDPSLPRAIILDLSPIRRDYGEIDIEVVLTCCQSGVVESLQRGGLFNDKVTKSCLFNTIHDAVLYCQSEKTMCQNDEEEEMNGTNF